MTSNTFVIRCQTADGNFTLSNLNRCSTVKKLKETIKIATDIQPEQMKILWGFPPRPLKYENDTAKLKEVEIESGETLIIQVVDSIDVQVVPDIPEPSSDEDQKDIKDYPILKMREYSKNDALSNFHGIMMRYDVPSNNSCLFTSIYFLLHRGEINLTKSNDLRKIIARAVERDPVKYNSAFLSRDNEEYCRWILNPSNWGGAIELAILSEHYKLEICAIDIISCKLLQFGENKNYEWRGFLVYDGIHYDPLLLQLESTQLTIFSVDDSAPLEMAMEVAREARSSRQFTDTHNFKLKCNECECRLTGDKEATAHAASTGHTQFGEL